MRAQRSPGARLWALAVLAAALLVLTVSAAAFYPALWPAGRLSAGSGFSGALAVDLNTADADTLCLLPGVGKKRAESILAYREEHGPFACVEDAALVPGIGEKTVASWGDMATVS